MKRLAANFRRWSRWRLRARWDLLPSLVRLVFPALILAAAGGCSRSREPDRRSDHDDALVPKLIGQQQFACDDDSQVDVHFAEDGLTAFVAGLPGQPMVKLKAEATGKSFVGDRVTATISGATIRFQQAGGALRFCQKL